MAAQQQKPAAPAAAAGLPASGGRVLWVVLDSSNILIGTFPEDQQETAVLLAKRSPLYRLEARRTL